ILMFVGLHIPLFLTALDITILASSLPTIGSEFQAMSLSSWAVTSYMVPFAVFQSLFPKFLDIIGRKPVIIFCLGLFLLGSLLCGLSKTITMLIASRAVQGIGGSGVFVIRSDLISIEKLGKYQWITSLTFTLASMTGPLIGASHTTIVLWRWIFYINLPLGGFAFALIYFFFNLPVEIQDFKSKMKRIDYIGSLLLLAAVTSFLLAIRFGGQTFPWKSSIVITLFILSGVFVAMLTVVEVKFAKEPLLPPRLFTNRTVVSLLLVTMLLGISNFVVIYYLLLYFQGVHGDSAMWSGIYILPMDISIDIFVIIFGFWASKYDTYRSLIVGSMSLLTLSVELFNLFSEETSWSMILGITVIGGIGKFQKIPTLVIVYLFRLSIPIMAAWFHGFHKITAVAIGLQRTIQIIGASIGISVAPTAFNSMLETNLSKTIPLEYSEMVIQSPPRFLRDGLSSEYFDAAIDAYVNAIRFVWQTMTIMAGLGI
ncbi:major facilitator superfamily domain-containing protein, partial [Fennellomyces sp. T-0311]